MTGCRTMCDTYRLGDFVSGYWARHRPPSSPNLTAHVCGRWPASLGCCHARGGALCRCIDEMASRTAIAGRLSLLDNATVAVHLRLGDVLDWPHYRDARGCSRYEAGCYYVHPLGFYRNVSLPRNVRKAVVVGNPRYRSVGEERHSIAYRAAVMRILSSRGLRVSLLNRDEEAADADVDLVVLTRAAWLLPARGGFGTLAKRCAHGLVLG